MVFDNDIAVRARVSAPTLTSVFWVSLFFGPFGFFAADEKAKQAAAGHFPRERYWIVFFIAWSFSALVWGAIFLTLVAGLGVFGALSTQVPQ